MNPDVLALLERLSGQKARPYSTFDFGRAKDTSCLSVVLPEERAKPLLFDIRKQLPPRFLAFIGTSQWLGDERPSGVEVAIGRGDSQFDILRLARSDACNCNMGTDDIIKKLEAWHQSWGIDIFHAETDTIELSLLMLLEDVQGFATEVYEFCPDIVDQGVGSVDALAKAIQDYRQLYLWWD